MSAATWISLVALVVAVLGPYLSRMRTDARRDGKIDAALEQTSRILADHEERLRAGKL